MGSTPDATSLYVRQQKVFAREVSGRFNRLRVAAAWGLLALFYGLPWLEWRGQQAVLFDLPARKFHIFGLIFFPQDFFLLTWLLVIAAVSLFFFTALGGRLWCGYACPQTVWTQVFVAMERWCEGNRQQQLKLDRAPWTPRKVLRKTAKQALWITFALFTGATFVGYFNEIRELAPALMTGSLGGWGIFWTLFYAFATYGNAGYLREQVCKYMCPYARFQSAMSDSSTLIIAYDEARGEPRGSRARGTDARTQGLGDCIDCTLCVQVCPTGIDIRNGLQMECIACAACIDACDSVMDRMQSPRGLVRYTTQKALEGGRARIVRPRTIVYGVFLLALIAGFCVAVTQRRLVELDVLRDRNGLYRELADGSIENVYTARLINKDTRPRTFHLSVVGLPGATLDTDAEAVRIEAGEIASVAIRIRVASRSAHNVNEVRIVARSDDGKALETTADARFISPGLRGAAAGSGR
jgi:cytochrome c oxidase accessory protein FixG